MSHTAAHRRQVALNLLRTHYDRVDAWGVHRETTPEPRFTAIVTAEQALSAALVAYIREGDLATEIGMRHAMAAAEAQWQEART